MEIILVERELQLIVDSDLVGWFYVLYWYLIFKFKKELKLIVLCWYVLMVILGGMFNLVVDYDNYKDWGRLVMEMVKWFYMLFFRKVIDDDNLDEKNMMGEVMRMGVYVWFYINDEEYVVYKWERGREVVFYGVCILVLVFIFDYQVLIEIGFIQDMKQDWVFIYFICFIFGFFIISLNLIDLFFILVVSVSIDMRLESSNRGRRRGRVEMEMELIF